MVSRTEQSDRDTQETLALLNNLSDRELIERFQQAASMRSLVVQILLVVRREQELMRFFRRRTQNEDDAWELYQRLIVRMYQFALDQFHWPNQAPQQAFDHWLFRCARNLFIDFVRRRQATPTLGAAVGDVQTSDQEPLNELIGNEELGHLRQLLDQITGLPGVLLREHVFSDVTMTELARKHRLSVSTVSRRIQQARENIRTLLETKGG